jgi:hypothetical protein
MSFRGYSSLDEFLLSSSPLIEAYNDLVVERNTLRYEVDSLYAELNRLIQTDPRFVAANRALTEYPPPLPGTPEYIAAKAEYDAARGAAGINDIQRRAELASAAIAPRDREINASIAQAREDLVSSTMTGRRISSISVEEDDRIAVLNAIQQNEQNRRNLESQLASKIAEMKPYEEAETKRLMELSRIGREIADARNSFSSLQAQYREALNNYDGSAESFDNAMVIYNQFGDLNMTVIDLEQQRFQLYSQGRDPEYDRLQSEKDEIRRAISDSSALADAIKKSGATADQVAVKHSSASFIDSAEQDISELNDEFKQLSRSENFIGLSTSDPKYQLLKELTYRTQKERDALIRERDEAILRYNALPPKPGQVKKTYRTSVQERQDKVNRDTYASSADSARSKWFNGMVEKLSEDRNTGRITGDEYNSLFGQLSAQNKRMKEDVALLKSSTSFPANDFSWFAEWDGSSTVNKTLLGNFIIPLELEPQKPQEPVDIEPPPPPVTPPPEPAPEPTQPPPPEESPEPIPEPEPIPSPEPDSPDVDPIPAPDPTPVVDIEPTPGETPAPEPSPTPEPVVDIIPTPVPVPTPDEPELAPGGDIEPIPGDTQAGGASEEVVIPPGPPIQPGEDAPDISETPVPVIDVTLPEVGDDIPYPSDIEPTGPPGAEEAPPAGPLPRIKYRNRYGKPMYRIALEGETQESFDSDSSAFGSLAYWSSITEETGRMVRERKKTPSVSMSTIAAPTTGADSVKPTADISQFPVPPPLPSQSQLSMMRPVYTARELTSHQSNSIISQENQQIPGGADMAEELNYNQQVPGFTLPKGQLVRATGTPVPGDESFIKPGLATVEGRVTNLVNQDNPLLQAARATAERQHQAKGLLHSSGAVQAGTAAVIQEATKIATPDAQTYSNLAQTRQKTQLDQSTNNQLAEIERRKLENNALITGALEYQAQTGRENLQKIADNAQLQRVQLENEWKDYLQSAQLDSTETQALMQASGAMGEELTGSIERILRDTNITNKTDAINVLMTRYKSHLNTVAAVAGIQLSWV